MLRDDLSLVHVMFFLADDLVVLVAFAGENDDVALFAVLDGVGDRFLAVYDLDVFAVG